MSSRIRIVTALCLVFSVFQVMAQYTLTMPYKQVTVENKNGTAVFTGAYSICETGQPALPSYAVSFLLPPDADISNVSVSLNSTIEQELSGLYEVNPKEPFRKGDVTPKGSAIVNGKDMNVYGKNAFFPAAYKGKASTAEMRQYKTVEVQINPYRYNPVTKKLHVLTGGTLQVSFGTTSNGSRSLPRDILIENILKETIVNPTVFDTYGNAPAPQSMLNSTNAATASVASANTASVSGIGYLIIAPNIIWNNSTQINSYRNSLTQQGYIVTTYDENTYNPNLSFHGDTLANSIRRTVLNWYNQCKNSGGNPQFVLLIGNPDPSTGNLPMKKWLDKNNYWVDTTDFYYGELSGGETPDSLDKLAEVAVGRIPVYNYAGAVSQNDIGHLDTYLSRVMNYVTKSGFDAEDRRFIMVPTDPVGFLDLPESFQLGEDLNNTLKPLGWGVCRLNEPYAPDYARNNYFRLVPEIINMNPLAEYVQCNENLVTTTWNTETPGLVVWYGHGNPYGTPYIMDVRKNSPAQLSSEYPAIVFAASCQTSEPDCTTNCGTQTLYYNAIGYVGSVDEIEYPDVTAKLFVQEIKGNNSIGWALVSAKANTSTYREHTYELNLYGCPEVSINLDQLGTTGIPQNFKATPAATSQISLTWTGVSGASSYIIERGQASSSSVVKRFCPVKINVPGGQTSYVDQNLVNGVTYRYKICSIDASGKHSAFSAIDSSSTLNPNGQSFLPAVPTGLAITVTGSNSLTIGWSSALNATSYNVNRSISASGPFMSIANTTQTSFTDNDLINNNRYYYKISAVNQYGQSAQSSNYVYGTPVDNLAAPQLLSVQSRTDESNEVIPGSVAFSWTMNTHEALSYSIEGAMKFPDNTYGDFTTLNIPIAGGVSLVPRFNSYVFQDNMPTNQRMGYRMLAKSENATTGYSNIVDFSNNPGITRVPPAPSGLTVTSGPEQAILNWSYSSSMPQYFEVYCKPNGGTWQLTYPSASVSDRTITIPGLYTNTTYSFCIRAVVNTEIGLLCSDFSNVATATIGTAIAAPTGLYAMINTAKQLDLNWNNNSTVADSFNIERATSSSGPFTSIKKTNYLSFTNTGLSDGTTYYYRVQAYRGSNKSAYSSVLSVSTLANLALNKTATASSQQSANPASNARDNSTTTRWCASSNALNQWWMVDLGANKNIAGVEIMWEKYGTGNVYKYKIEVSTDNVNWTTAADLTYNTSIAQTQANYFGYVARYVRITVTGLSANCWASFFEARVYGNCDVTYDSREGSSIPDVNVQDGAKITSPVPPKRIGYVFGGWYKDSACTLPWNFSTDVVNTPTTLYAKWIIRDADGNVYTEVKLGNQVWMVENLKTTKFSDSTSIPQVSDSTQWYNLSSPAYCYMNNNSANNTKFGKLYNSYAVATDNLAPAGWHVPTDADWTELINYLIANGYNYDGTTTGNAVAKSLAAQSEWLSSAGVGTPGNDLPTSNKSGFTAYPGSMRYDDAGFGTSHFSSGLGQIGCWWSSNSPGITIYNKFTFTQSTGTCFRTRGINYAFSVRLVRNRN